MKTLLPPSQKVSLWPWRPLYWEPVAGTGERIMIGILHGFEGDFRARRTIRDDVLDCMYGKSAVGLRRLIEHALRLYQAAAQAIRSLDSLEVSMSGLHAGPLRMTAANSSIELLQTACLLYSSMCNLDKLDEDEESDAPQQEEVNRRFGSEIREEVEKVNRYLSQLFGKSAKLVQGGQPVKFGFLSDRAVLHFTVFHPTRHGASMKDARARIWELLRARDVGQYKTAALIAAVPREDDATLGTRQREKLRSNRYEIESEAESEGLRCYGVHNAHEGAEKVLELAA